MTSLQRDGQWSWEVRPRYLGWSSLLTLSGVAGFSVWSTANALPTWVQFGLLGLVGLLWFAYNSFSLPSAVFATVALLPVVEFGGEGYLDIAGQSLTPSEVVMTAVVVASISLWSKVGINTFLAAVICLAYVGAVSLLLSLRPEALYGSVIRLAVLTLFLIVVVGSHGANMKRALLLGPLAWPFVALAAALVQGHISSLLTLESTESIGLVLRSAYPKYLLLLVPLLLFWRPKRWRLLLAVLLVYLGAMLVQSFSRSFVFGILVAAVLSIFAVPRGRRLITFAVVSGAVVSLIAFTPVGSYAFDFSNTAFVQSNEGGPKSASNLVRSSKISHALDTWEASPLLGSGYGSSVFGGNIDTSMRRLAGVAGPAARSWSPEFGPVQVLSEVGLIGAMVLIGMVVTSATSLFQCLLSPRVPPYIKALLVLSGAVGVAEFVGATILNRIPIWLALPIVARALFIRDNLESPCLPAGSDRAKRFDPYEREPSHGS